MSGKICVLAVYVPETHKELLKEALFRAGAGCIGNYDSCCWETAGTGQFRPLSGADPFIGSEGVIEHVREWKLEMVVEEARLGAVLDALKRTHPYETPAFHWFRAETDDPASLQMQ